MNDPNVPSSAAGERVTNPATLVYIAVVVGAVLGVGVLTILGARGIVSPTLDIPLLTLRIFGLVLLVLGFVAVGMLSGGIPPRSVDVEESEWWRANSTRAVSAWATAEGLSLLGAVFWLLSGDMILYVGLVGGGLVLLLLNRPRRMLEG